ncbi:carboxymuconolactone decarboxylase family protein [Actinoallomurus iriomotensis]|uniref:carboxymuconolactone decarboxylase family protein n=1 Tax=Actinoallomurus iriomotensis TaxID=478107 RepID=UPI0025540063|nr:carboxymuconolactone decarboxylase family protein [Actinoallomurus iriomotensis]
MTQATSAACHIQPCGFRQCNSAGKVVHDSTLPAATQELVKIRASQINGSEGFL